MLGKSLLLMRPRGALQTLPSQGSVLSACVLGKAQCCAVLKEKIQIQLFPALHSGLREMKEGIFAAGGGQFEQ